MATAAVNQTFGKCRECEDPAQGRDGLCRPCRGFFSAHTNFAGRQGRVYEWNEEKDSKLKRCYACEDRRELSRALSRLAGELGFPKGALRRRAEQLGLTMWSTVRWTPPEIEFLEEHAGTKTVGWIVRKLRERTGIGRSYNAVKCKAAEIGRSLRFREGYTKADLQELFGTTYFTVDKWFARGWMTADARGRVSETGVLDFLQQHPDEWHFRRMDEPWLKSLLFSSATFGR